MQTRLLRFFSPMVKRSYPTDSEKHLQISAKISEQCEKYRSVSHRLAYYQLHQFETHDVEQVKAHYGREISKTLKELREECATPKNR